MTRQTTIVRLTLALALAAAASAAACRQQVATAEASKSSALRPGVSPYDVETTDVARVLSGITPVRREDFATLLEMRVWWDYQAESRSRWASAWSARFQPVQAWAAVELKAAAGNCQTLLHPFGGTDFLTAYLLFPGCEGYVLVGSEAVGQLPTLDKATTSQVASVTEDVRRAFPGGVPARRQRPAALRGPAASRSPPPAADSTRAPRRTDCRRLALRPCVGRQASRGDPDPRRQRETGCAQHHVRGAQRTAAVARLPARRSDDTAMKRRPAVWTFLRLQAPFTTLLAPVGGWNGDRATILRELVVDQSLAILQERPVIPERLLGQRRWTVSTLPGPPVGAFVPGAAPTLAVRRGGPA